VNTAAVYRGDFPDPFVLAIDGRYYAYATNGQGANVQLLSSPDLSHWSHHGDALPRLPAWAEAGNTWSPSVLARPGGLVLYYTVREPGSGRQAISLAVANGPGGPFVDSSDRPLIFQRDLGGSIDPSPFVDADGQPFLLWKSDANAIGRASSLWAQRLAADGRSLLGEPTRLLTHDQQWERPLIEAPSARLSAGRYYLFYSGGWGVGYAVAARLLGPYRKVTTTGPWLGSDDNVAGPGGQEFFLHADGDLRMAFHGWQPDAVGYPKGARSLRIVVVSLDELALPEESQGSGLVRRFGTRMTKRRSS
jgi:beta-xylosidase